MSTKQTNPKDAIGIKKVPFNLVPGQVLGEINLAMFEGSRKYGAYNFRMRPIKASVYFEAIDRHMKAFIEGQDIDPESNLCHLAKASACLVILQDARLNGNLIDDRPPKAKNQNWIDYYNKKVVEIIEKYPNGLPPYTEL